MLDSKDHSTEAASRDFSDQDIRKFLFAQLRTARRTKFESALFADPQLEPRVRLAELELADDYAFNRLTTKQRRRVREIFLVSSGRRNALEISMALRQQAADASASLTPSALAKSRAVVLLRHPVWRFAFASLILALLLASAWLVTKEPQLVRQIIPRRLRPAAVSTPTPEVAHHGTDSGASPTHQDEPSQSPEHEAGVQTFVLTRSNEAPAPLTLSNGTVSVRFELEVDRPAQSGYRAEVVTHAGETVFTVSQIYGANQSSRVSFDVPANVLRAGDFQIRLTPLADNSPVATYDFRVQ